MKRKIRPASEELGIQFELILVSLLWYGTLVTQIIERGFQMSIVIFLMAGLIPIVSMVEGTKRALFYRRERANALSLGRVQTGNITGVSRKNVPIETKKGRQRYKAYYFLTVEIVNPQNGAVSQFLSDAYAKPIHKYLSGTRVSVYTDQSGWHHFLEDFQWKERKSDPDIFNTPREYASSNMMTMIVRIMLLLMTLLMLFTVFGRA